MKSDSRATFGKFWVLRMTRCAHHYLQLQHFVSISVFHVEGMLGGVDSTDETSCCGTE